MNTISNPNQKTYGNDSITVMKQAVMKITEEREWQKFHTPKNMAMDVVREASELLEHFVWDTNEEISHDPVRKSKIADEMADVLHSLLLLSDVMKIDLADAFWTKLEEVKKKYPADLVQGKSGYWLKNKK